MFRLPFCANNLLQSNPKRYRRSIQKYAVVNPDLYYGAEISIRFFKVSIGIKF